MCTRRAPPPPAGSTSLPPALGRRSSASIPRLTPKPKPKPPPPPPAAVRPWFCRPGANVEEAVEEETKEGDPPPHGFPSCCSCRCCGSGIGNATPEVALLHGRRRRRGVWLDQSPPPPPPALLLLPLLPLPLLWLTVEAAAETDVATLANSRVRLLSDDRAPIELQLSRRSLPTPAVPAAAAASALPPRARSELLPYRSLQHIIKSSWGRQAQPPPATAVIIPAVGFLLLAEGPRERRTYCSASRPPFIWGSGLEKSSISPSPPPRPSRAATAPAVVRRIAHVEVVPALVAPLLLLLLLE